MASFTPTMSTGIVLLWLFSCTFCSSLASISYEDYCHDTLALAEEEGRQHDITSSSISSNFPLGFRRAFFSGGSPLFDTNSTVLSLWRPAYSAYFATSTVKLEGEQASEKYVVAGTLLLRNRSRLWSRGTFNRTTVFRQPRGARRDPFLRLGGIKLTVKGLWVARSGTLCMAGCFGQDVMGQFSREDCQVKAVLQYPVENSIRQPLVKGVIESKRERQDPLFFEPVHITGVADTLYTFRKNDEHTGNWPVQRSNVPSNIKVWKDERAVCQFPWHKQRLMVAQDKQCTGNDCGLFEMIPGNATYLSVENMVCAEGKSHSLFIFSHDGASSFQTRYYVLSVEGAWNMSTGQLYASACYLKGATNESLKFDSEDCDIQITLQFPTTLSLLFRYSVVGRVERKKNSKLPSFRKLSFTGNMDISYGSFGWGSSPPRMEYVYTEERIKQAQDRCLATSSSQRSKRSWMVREKPKYPDGQIFADFGFQASMKDSFGSSVSAFFSPVAINGRTNTFFNPNVGVVTSAVSAINQTKCLNISFDINFYSMKKVIKPLENTTLALRFPAEGVYDLNTGKLYLSACRALTQSTAWIGSKLYDGDKDCEIVITIQYPSINSGFFDKHRATGQMMSIREQKDPLFFNPVLVSSASFFYQEQAADSLKEIDFEIVMRVISLTMGVVFIGLQLWHVKKNPKVLPQMSLLMLSVLTLGHLIPLILNFEAIFSSRSRQTVLQWSGGWLEINEVIVRLMTMLVFLMLLRLVYLSWVSKSEVSPGEGPWHMERGALRICLTVYALGGLSALIVYGIKGSNVLDAMKGFAGLIIDFFLIPQVVGNYLWEIQGMVLSSPFYLGMTLVRVLPHLFDIVRKFEFFSVNNRRYYYANPTWDYYSSAWDAIIPFGNVVLAVLVCVQQRYGGACFSVSSWRKTRQPYIKVSMNPI